MPETILLEAEEKMEHTLLALHRDFSTVRSGRANPKMLEKVNAPENTEEAKECESNRAVPEETAAPEETSQTEESAPEESVESQEGAEEVEEAEEVIDAE